MPFECPVCGYTNLEVSNDFQCSCGYTNTPQSPHVFQPNSQRTLCFSRRKSFNMIALAIILILIMSLALFIPTVSNILASLGICVILVLTYGLAKCLAIIFKYKYAIIIDSSKISFSSFYNYNDIPLSCIKSINFGTLSLQANVPFITINTVNDELYVNRSNIVKSIFKLDSVLFGGNITIRGDLLEISPEEVSKCLNEYLTYSKSATP